MDKIYLAMNKPTGYVCSSVSDSHKTVYSLLSSELQFLLGAKRGEKLHTVGRLDSLTSGLLFFTTDGQFSNLLTRPQNHVEKTYRVVLRDRVNSLLQADYMSAFLKGIMLPAEKKAPEQLSGPAKLIFVSENECLVTIKEGKFHQVRRLFLAKGNLVTKLERLCIGGFSLPEDLKPGEYRSYKKEELERLIFTFA